MATVNQKTVSVKKPAENNIQLQDLWGLFWPNWYWFLLSVVVSLSVAGIYLMRTPALYTRTASILIKEDGKNGGAAMSEFADMGIFKSNTNINNELVTLKSPTLMFEVVTRLGLNMRYQTRQGLRQVELYKSSPVEVLLADRNKEGFSFDMELLSAEQCRLSHFIVAGKELDQSLTLTLGDSLSTTPVGELALYATPAFSSDWIGKKISFHKGAVQSYTEFYAGALQAILSSKEASIIDLSITDPSIQKAEDILNTLVEVYNEKWILDKNQIAISTSQFISDRLEVIESELGHVDENISTFKSQHLMPDVQAASSLYMEQSAANKRELLALNTQLTTARYIRQELNKQALDQLLPTNSGINSGDIQSQIGEYNQLVLDRNRLLANSSEKNPLVQDLAVTLQSLKSTILRSVDNLIVSLNTQIRSIKQQEVVTTDQLASNPNQAKYLLSVERQQKVKEQLYLYLLQKREENELSQAFTAYNTRLINAPRGSNAPTAPNTSKILLAAFAIGLMFPAVILFMRENLNTKVRGRQDLAHLSIPFAGEIPLSLEESKKGSPRRGRKGMYSLVVKEGSRDVINEAFRVLRSNVDFILGKHTEAPITVITSFNPGSGKSFLIANLALCYGIKGKRILVIDGDLRHRSLSRYAQSTKIGLSNYLGGQEENWESLLVAHDTHPNLQLLPVGTTPPNPTELLENGRLAVLLAEARTKYDYIFIDCPPIDIVADTQIIAQEADHTLFVVRAGLLERSMLADLEEIYTQKRFKNLAMILNGTEVFGGRYHYRYGYRYGYGYGNYYANSTH